MATSAADNFDEAIGMFSDDARTLYDEARVVADPARLRKHDEPDSDEVKFAQSQLERALSQMVSAATLQAQETDRAGFAAVVKLMETTAERADVISSRLINETDASMINALSNALAALAQLSPSEVWTKQGASGGR